MNEINSEYIIIMKKKLIIIIIIYYVVNVFFKCKFLFINILSLKTNFINAVKTLT